MSSILVIGAGRSSFYLIDYLHKLAKKHNHQLVVADAEKANLLSWEGQSNIETVNFSLEDEELTHSLIQKSEVVVSLLPPALHIKVARLCLRFGKHLATASYVSAEMQELNAEAQNKGLTFINELGLDPGLDHLSAMKLLDEIRSNGGEVKSFESYCGGLVCDEDTGDNPWKYKFSWNPRNVILAAQGGPSLFRKEGVMRMVPPGSVFRMAGQIDVPELGTFDHYANRDSLHYETLYGLENAETLYRSTLRREGYCAAWQVLIDLGFTDAQYELPAGINSFKELCKSLSGWNGTGDWAGCLVAANLIESRLEAYFNYLQAETEMTERTTEKYAADLLQTHLMKRWKLESADKDEVVMHHRIRYTKDNKEYQINSTLNVKGEDGKHTAMAKTVGLPLALGVEMILNKLTPAGVLTPVTPVFYNYILPKLEKESGIGFKEFLSVINA